jgi:F-type H+-transporting ATPase subunit gamma
MSRSHQLQLHITQMNEIRTILNSMKNMTFMEIHKLARFQVTQGQAVANIEQAATDFLSFYPKLSAIDVNTDHICILIGTERGFCGDFNESLISKVTGQAFSGVILIGNRLESRWPDNNLKIIASLAGANVTEEVPGIINSLIDTIDSLQKTHSTLALSVIYHESNQIMQKQLLPSFANLGQQTLHYGNPPILNLEPNHFFSELIDHYLFAILYEIFYISLIAENHRRLQHLDAAVQHLDEDTASLHRKSQVYRQEEITEEIEVILLNAENI